MQPKLKRIFGLDLMRAVAVFMVLLAHTTYIFPEYRTILINVLELIGIQGVELFFVLSGFLIGSISLKLTNNTDFSLNTIKYFWVRRWFRTLPLYFLILLVNIFIVYSVYNSLPDNFLHFFIFFQNLVSEHPLFFPEAWSLSVEEFAYIFAPIVIFILGLIFNKNKNIFLIATLFLIALFLMTKVFFYLKHFNSPLSLKYWDDNLKEVVIYRLDAIYYGFIVAYLHCFHTTYMRESRFKLLIIGIALWVFSNAMLLVVSSQVGLESFFLDVLYLPLNSIAISMILPFLYYLKSPNRIVVSIIQKMSMYSYAMYLLHYSIVLFLMRFVFPFADLGFNEKLLYVLLYFVITYVLASIVYQYYEKPMTNLREHRFFKKDLPVN